MMTPEEFTTRIEQLGALKDVAEEISNLSGLKMTSNYLSAMKSGRRPISPPAAVYVYLKTEGQEPTNAELIKMLEARLK